MRNDTMKPDVILLYDRDCPNVSQARANLRSAFSAAGMTGDWRELDLAAPETPEHLRRLGSPTILVGGADVCGAADASGASCRVYRDADARVVGAPPEAAIAGALRTAGASAGGKKGFLRAMSAVPGAAVALLPAVACPACWPVYAGILSAAGLGFLLQGDVLLPVTAGLLAVALAGLAWRARSRRGYRPLAVGAVACAILLVGKVRFDFDPAIYVGAALLIAASIWNSWPRRARDQTYCPSCVATGEDDTGSPSQ